MKLAFGIYKYFPYSGLALDMVRIAKECVKRGHQVTIFTQDWQGSRPEGVNVVLLKTSGLSNHENAASFNRAFSQNIQDDGFDLSVGFNKIPNVDYYFCGDFCYVEHSINKNNILYRWTARYRCYKEFEQAIFGKKSKTKILSLSSREDKVFQKHYSTPKHRFINLPPMLDKALWVNNKNLPSRAEIRSSLGIRSDQILMLFVGSDFERKGLDRALLALASLDKKLQKKVMLCVAGQSKVGKYQQIAEKLDVIDCVQFLGPRDDVPALMKAGDFLIHPARAELAGGVIVEAIVSGLSVIVTPVCGYAWHVKEADAGIVLGNKFEQAQLNRYLSQALVSDERGKWRENGINYSKDNNLYSMAEVAVDEFEINDSNKIGLNAAPQANPLKNNRWVNQVAKRTSSWNRCVGWLETNSSGLASLLEATDKKINGKQHLDDLISSSSNVLKDDRTTTVVSGVSKVPNCILKRYNARNLNHVFTRAVRRSRARRCWSMSYVFSQAGLNVARPVFMFEQRIGPLRLDAYFVSEALEGEELLTALPKMGAEEKQAVVVEIKHAFKKMLKAKISHGDMKATNIMWSNNKLFFIDLDASKQHKFSAWSKWRNTKDIRRFLRNWDEQPELLALFDGLT